MMSETHNHAEETFASSNEAEGKEMIAKVKA
jgi:hypothetical protein